MTLLTVAKLEATGDDFLVVLDWEARSGPSPSRARRLCDRHHGADGVMSVLSPCAGGDVRMELVNADGIEAEMTGNGVRCVVLAVLDWGLVARPTLTVETAAGLRRVSAADSGTAAAALQLTAEMGTVRLDPGSRLRCPAPGPVWLPWATPNLVIAGDAVRDVDISVLGPQLERSQAGAVKVEPVTVDPANGELRLTVWERGAGATSACGTSSCAAAAVAPSWSPVDEEVAVRNPGECSMWRCRGTTWRRRRRCSSATCKEWQGSRWIPPPCRPDLTPVEGGAFRPGPVSRRIRGGRAQSGGGRAGSEP